MINRRSGISTVVAAGAAVAVLMSGCLRGNRCGHTCVSSTNQVQPENEVSHSPRCELHPNSLTCSCRNKQRTIYTRERVALASPYNLAATKTGCGCSDAVVSPGHPADHSKPTNESNPATTPDLQEQPAPGAPHLIDPPIPTSMTSEIENVISDSAQPNFISQTVSSRVTLPVRTDHQHANESARETLAQMQPPMENGDGGSEKSSVDEEKLYYPAKDSGTDSGQPNSTSVSLANDSTPATNSQSEVVNRDAPIDEQTASQPYTGPIVDPMLGEEAESTLEFVNMATQSDQPIRNEVNIDQLANQIVAQIQSQQTQASSDPSPELASTKTDIEPETNPFQVTSETNSVLADQTDSDEKNSFTPVPAMNVNARTDTPKVVQNETTIKTNAEATQAESVAEPTPVLPNANQSRSDEQVVLRATAGNDPVDGQRVRVAELAPHATTKAPTFPTTDAAELEFMIRPLPHMESRAYVHSPSEYEFRTVPSYHMPTLRAVPEMKKRDHLPSVFKMRSVHSGPEPKKVANNYFEVNYPEFSPVPSPQFNPLERGQRETHSVEPVPVIKPLPKVEGEEVKVDSIRGLTQRPEDRDPIR